jgi:hypothetical protein
MNPMELTVKKMEVFQISDEVTLPADLEKCANERLFPEMARNVTRNIASGKAMSAHGGLLMRCSFI